MFTEHFTRPPDMSSTPFRPTTLDQCYDRRAQSQADGHVDAFHAHLDTCEQCREQPFNLCSAGARLLKGSATQLRVQPGRLFEQLGARVATLPASRVHYLITQMAQVRWMRHITDDVFRCVLCDVQEGHSPDCVVRLFTTGQAGSR